MWLKLKNNWVSHLRVLRIRELQYEVTAAQQTYCWAAHYVATIVGKVKNRLIWGCKIACVNACLLTAEKSPTVFVHRQQPQVSAALKGFVLQLHVLSVCTCSYWSTEKWQHVPSFTRLIEKDYSCFLKVREMHCTWRGRLDPPYIPQFTPIQDTLRMAQLAWLS